jgi:hypothetical protein
MAASTEEKVEIIWQVLVRLVGALAAAAESFAAAGEARKEACRGEAERGQE